MRIRVRFLTAPLAAISFVCQPRRARTRQLQKNELPASTTWIFIAPWLLRDRIVCGKPRGPHRASPWASACRKQLSEIARLSALVAETFDWTPFARQINVIRLDPIL
jgi:hypothetical protein